MKLFLNILDMVYNLLPIEIDGVGGDSTAVVFDWGFICFYFDGVGKHWFHVDWAVSGITVLWAYLLRIDFS